VSEREEFVEYKINVKIPQKLHSLLVDLAKFVGISIEEMLTEEMDKVLECFCECGFYEAWTEIALQKKGI